MVEIAAVDMDTENKGKKKTITVLLVLLLLVGGVYWYRMREARDADPFAEYKVAMQRDDVGGSTPEETLRMFISALRANDDVAAARLFMLDKYGSRTKWEARFAELKMEGMLTKMADDIEKNAQKSISAYETNAQFEVLDQNELVKILIVMELNKFSGVWKLQGF
jgi:hypothetical protein